MNFLEELSVEWYEFHGYFVRRNIRTRKRAKGGYDAELDVLAYLPAKKELIHVETSGDADSWAQRRERFLKKKFMFSRKEYEVLLGGCEIIALQQVALVGWTRSVKGDINWGKDIEVVLIPEFLQTVVDTLRKYHPMKQAVPEGYPILRSIQMVVGFCT